MWDGGEFQRQGGFGSGHGLPPALFQAREPLESIGVNSRTGSHVLGEETVDGVGFEVGDDNHPETARGFSPLLDGDQAKRCPTPLELTASSIPAWVPPTQVSSISTSPRSGSRAKLIMARRSYGASSRRFRNVEGQAGAGGATPRHRVYRWSSGRLPRTTGSAVSSYYEGRPPRSLSLDDHRRRIPSVLLPPTRSRDGVRSEDRRTPLASGAQPGLSGRPLRWRIQPETGGVSQERLDVAPLDIMANNQPETIG